MTIWLCDRCGKQVKRIAQSAGKYRIKKTIYDNDSYGGTQRIERDVRFCDECSMEMEKFLDDEFSNWTANIVVEAEGRKVTTYE